ncbi:hypothetical protein AB0B45_28860 [Nonomuraea sp. NPDC049152]|uniref:hypothetical protein n=1 Tax=Nonomuraea sp. NPDC049152 TaxID=3154350 RepID=UPI0033C350CA
MATHTSPIKAVIICPKDAEEIPLDMLREALKKTRPDLLRSAAEEFAAVRIKLDTLVEAIDKHLKILDTAWTVGEDAKQVKTQLRRMRDSAVSIMDAIADDPPGKPSTKGIAPALAAYSDTVAVFRGDTPGDVGSDISTLEAAGQWGMGGAGIGFLVGGPPGAVIGGVVGTIAGGITSLFSDVPFLNLVGESKQEKEMKAAREHLTKLTDATMKVNDLFPASLTTDIPQLTVPPFNTNNVPPPGSNIPGAVPATTTSPYDSSMRSGLDELRDVDLRGVDDPGGVGDLGDVGDVGDGLGGSGTGGHDVDGSGIDDKIQSVDPSALDIDANPGRVDGSVPGVNGVGNGAGEGNGNGTSLGKTTSLSGYDPSLAQTGITDPTSFGNGNSSGSGHSSNGVGVGVSAGASGGASGAGGGGGGRGGITPTVLPHGGSGSKTEEEERWRDTCYLEDEDLFQSDAKFTIGRIDHVSKDKA